MARRRRRTPVDSLLDDGVFVVVLVLVITILVVPWLWKIVIALLCAIGIFIYFVLYLRHIEQLRLSGVYTIDRMTGPEFEKRLWVLFTDLEYKVEATPISGDWGADLILEKAGIKTAVQIKRYAKPVDGKAIQEAVAAKAHYGCSKSMVITNNTFTSRARTLAWENGTELWDREKLIRELTKLQLKTEGRQ